MKQIIVIAGPTAVGKTKYAIEAACAFNGEIVSCDSMQLYKYMNIGSAKPTLEELSKAKHHLVDIIDPVSYTHLITIKILRLLLTVKILELKLPEK